MGHSTPALLQGLVPSLVRGARLLLSQSQGWAEVGEESVLTAPDPAEPCHSPHPLPTLAVSFLCKQCNKLFGDRQAQIWLQWCWGETGSWACTCALSLWAPGPLFTQGSKQPQETALKRAERFLLYSHVLYKPYTYMPIHTHTSLQQARLLKAARIRPHCEAASFSGQPPSCPIPGDPSARLSLCTVWRWMVGVLGSLPTPWLGSLAPRSG